MRLAATYGQAWVTTGDRSGDGLMDAAGGAKVVRDQIARLEDACVSAGRDPTTVDRLVLTGPDLDPGLTSEESFADTAGQYADAGATDLVVHWPRKSEPYAGDEATFERIFSRR
jgi:alkanesulfonate monooxygenase SsuD/methylene tetrahydromethanopterin reductase-like flavin-dependent oxidoreductase (luciferase family)